MIEWRVRLIIVCLLEWKIDKIEGEIDNRASLANEEKVRNTLSILV